VPFGRLWYGEPDAISDAIDYAKFFSRSHGSVIRVCDDVSNVIETQEHKGDFKEPQNNSGVFRIALESFLIAGRQNEN
jgi:hypothetical protein